MRLRLRGRGLGPRLGLRWVHLLQGGALLMPYFLLMTVVLGVTGRKVQPFGGPMDGQFLAYGLSLPLVAATALFPFIRTLEATTARALCCLPDGVLVAEPAESWAAKRRTAVWFTLHAGLGALVSGATLAIPPMAGVLIALPFSGWLQDNDWGWGHSSGGVLLWTSPLLGLAMLAALTLCAYGVGALLAHWAPTLLGPTPADRLAAAERRTAELASRNRLARELHDSVGHALSAVGLQASAARRLLDSARDADRAFVRGALAAIEDTSRSAVAELDSVLGVLRGGADAAGGGAG
ncbi:sensor histidine kinase, partial [Streptomyces boncukensis]